jgi:aminopeptidase N
MFHRVPVAIILVVFVPLMNSCSKHSDAKSSPPAQPVARDVHSYGNPDEARVRHVSLDLDVVFSERTIQGTAVLTIERVAPAARHLVLDSKALQIDETEVSADGAKYREAHFEMGRFDPILGRPVMIDIAPDTKFVRVRYSTSPSNATALQWLAPEQTEGKAHPFLYTQGEAIHTRSWIPLQDSPGVRLTWDARVHAPDGLRAVMSGIGSGAEFRMEHPVPPYLIALAVGDLQFKATGPRTGVWAEPPILERAAVEFADTEKMLEAAEKLYGPYRWGRYDLLVMPPSFPFGGMENPCLTFATPTVIAGDKSLVSLVAHELAHSWSGNLVTNATWSDFWLNEGYTVYFERRILEEIYGRGRAEMEAALGYQDLQDELKRQTARDQILAIDLAGRDPDDGMTEIPYEKGALFLLAVERSVGREKLDAYLKAYFDRFAFQSITTAQSLDYMRRNMTAPAAFDESFNEWVYQPGLPASAPVPQAEAFAAVDAARTDWMHSKPVDTAGWSTQEWMQFLRGFPAHIDAAHMKALDKAFHFTDTGNDEILAQWLLMAVRNRYAAANERLEDFLTTVGRRKYVKPLYMAMLSTGGEARHAQAIYEKARPLYHPITQATIDEVIVSLRGESKK